MADNLVFTRDSKPPPFIGRRHQSEVGSFCDSVSYFPGFSHEESDTFSMPHNSSGIEGMPQPYPANDPFTIDVPIGYDPGGYLHDEQLPMLLQAEQGGLKRRHDGNFAMADDNLFCADSLPFHRFKLHKQENTDHSPQYVIDPMVTKFAPADKISYHHSPVSRFESPARLFGISDRPTLKSTLDDNESFSSSARGPVPGIYSPTCYRGPFVTNDISVPPPAFFQQPSDVTDRLSLNLWATSSSSNPFESSKEASISIGSVPKFVYDVSKQNSIDYLLGTEVPPRDMAPPRPNGIARFQKKSAATSAGEYEADERTTRFDNEEAKELNQCQDVNAMNSEIAINLHGESLVQGPRFFNNGVEVDFKGIPLN